MTDASRRSPGRSLVVVEATLARETSPASITSGRADAAFLAHLLAVRARMPAQRTRCRATPETGAAAYRSGLALLQDDTESRLRLRA